jgi:hypothetical protein
MVVESARLVRIQDADQHRPEVDAPAVVNQSF